MSDARATPSPITETLSEPAMKMINAYLRLPFSGVEVSCPYYNNRRQKVRGALRVLIGKGTPKDIAEEAKIVSLRDKIEIAGLDADGLKKFLIDNNLGIDCSGFVYHVLNAELASRRLKKINEILKYKNSNPLRKILCFLRPAENTSVQVFADSFNSREVILDNTRPADMIIMLEADTNDDMHHVLIVHGTERANGVLKKIHYSHSIHWATDGQYGGGVRQGEITIVNPKKPLLKQIWVENGKTNTENETWRHAAQAKTLKIIRLKRM